MTNPSLRLSTIALLAVSPLAAAPLISIGENFDLYFNGSATVRYVDNLLLENTNEKEDTIFIFSPGLELSFGRNNAAWNGRLVFREDIDVYSQYDDLNNQKANLNIDTRYNSGVFEGSANFKFSENDQPTPDVRGTVQSQVQREVTNFSSYGEYTFSDKTSFGAGAEAGHTYYQTFRSFFPDQTTYGIPVDLYWKYSSKLDFSVGYRWRQYDLPGNFSDTTNHFLNVGVRGSIAPKLDGRIQVGATMQSPEVGEDRNSVGVITNLTYIATPKLRLNLNALRDFAVSSFGTATENTEIGLSALYAFSPLFSANSGIKYSKADYKTGTRDDDSYDFNIGFSYSPNDYIRLSAGYIYQQNSSSIAAYDYSVNVIHVSASLRY